MTKDIIKFEANDDHAFAQLDDEGVLYRLDLRLSIQVLARGEVEGDEVAKKGPCPLLNIQFDFGLGRFSILSFT